MKQIKKMIGSEKNLDKGYRQHMPNQNKKIE